MLDDYSNLPNYDTEKLKESFENIIDQYTSSLSDKHNKPLEDKKTVISLTTDKNIVNYAIEILRYKYHAGIEVEHEYLENLLKDKGYPIHYNNAKEFHKELDRVSQNSKGIDYNIKRKLKEIELSKSDNKSNYMDSVTAIEESLGIKIDIYRDTMIRFISYRKRFENKIKKAA